MAYVPYSICFTGTEKGLFFGNYRLSILGSIHIDTYANYKRHPPMRSQCPDYHDGIESLWRAGSTNWIDEGLGTGILANSRNRTLIDAHGTCHHHRP